MYNDFRHDFIIPHVYYATLSRMKMTGHSTVFMISKVEIQKAMTDSIDSNNLRLYV